MSHQLVLIVGAADTGRAPMAAALLSRLTARAGLAWTIASAGVVGHDDAPAEPEARSAMLSLGLNIEAHRARSLTPELVAAAAALVAVESGIARVLRARQPEATVVSLGELAGQARDIPDPFRMQLGAWVHYAGEIEALLKAGLPRLRALVDGEPVAAAPEPPAPAAVATPEPGRLAAVERAVRLLGLIADMPGVVDWGGASAQLAADLETLATPQAPGDLARPYVALLKARLNPAQGAPPPPLARSLAADLARLRAPIGAAELEALTA